MCLWATVLTIREKAIKRLVKILTKADSHKQIAIGIEIRKNLFIILVCSDTSYYESIYCRPRIIAASFSRGKKFVATASNRGNIVGATLI